MELVTPGLGIIFWMALSFGIVLFILGKYAWKPIMKALHEREHRIDESLHAAEKARQDMEALKFSNEQLLAEAKEERDAMMRSGRKVRDNMLEESRHKAGEEANRIIEAAKASIEFEKMAAITELKNQVAQLSIEIAERIMKEELAKSGKQEEFIKRLLDDVKFN